MTHADMEKWTTNMTTTRQRFAWLIMLIPGAMLLWHTPVRSQTESKLTVTELKARIHKLQQGPVTQSADGFDKAIAELKALAPPTLLQSMLADLYAEAMSKDKITILYVLDKVGVEHAAKALPPIAADFAVARPKHPNDMSFAGFYVLEKFMGLAWKKLPAKDRDGKKVGDKKIDVKPIPKHEPVDEKKPTRVAADGYTHSGSIVDRKIIREIILESKLLTVQGKTKPYVVPAAEDDDWVRVVGDLAFVRLRGKSRGSDYLFIRSKAGHWSYLANLGHWVN
jgi:hypothetical protein